MFIYIKQNVFQYIIRLLSVEKMLIKKLFDKSKYLVNY